MAEVTEQILNAYNILLSKIPPIAQTFIQLFLLVLLVFGYAWFIWKLYRFIAHKNILGLNLNKYNKSEHPFFAKLFAGLLYFVEYILILPFLIFFWFVIFAIFLILITEGIEVSAILIIATIIVAAIRMTSYYSEDLSKDLAKMLPFTLLAVAITKPGFFNFTQIITHLQKVPSVFGQIITYLSFIIFLEKILRALDFTISLFGLEETIIPEETETANQN